MQKSSDSSSGHTRGFTIVELLIVIVVIAILAAIAVVSYNGIIKRAKEGVLQSDLRNTAVRLELIKSEEGSYPASGTSMESSAGTTITYVSSGADKYCATATLEGYAQPFHITEKGTVESGECPITDGSLMQIVTKNNCPSTRTRAVDARDNHTYWIQKLADGKCWMLTDLAYTGSGVTTYGDTHTLSDCTDDDINYFAPCYYELPSGTSTYEPTAPSTANNGSGQYGIYYNWCGVMAGQIGTTACHHQDVPAADYTQTICPSGWQLPSGGAGSDFVALNNAINGGSTGDNSGLLTNWLATNNGGWSEGFVSQGSHGNYWSSTTNANQSPDAYVFAYYTFWWNAPDGIQNKFIGISARCLIK